MSAPDRWLLTGIGVAIVTAFAVLAQLDGLERRIPLFLSLYAVAFALYAAAVAIALRARGRSTRTLVLVVGVALAARLVLVPAPPALSTDVYRYVWEGRVVAHGYNPFAHAPDAPELEHLRDANYDGINHKDMATIYPPVAQGLFAMAALLRPSVAAQKLVFVLFDIGAVLVLIPLLGRCGVDPARSVIYAWNPLVIFETGHSGHLDAVGVFLTLLGIWLVLRGKNAAGFAAFAAGFLSKFVTGVLAPFFLFKRRYAPWLVLAAVLAVAAYLPFAGAGRGLASSLRVYSSQWQFNALAYGALLGAWNDPMGIRWLLGALLATFVVWYAIRQTDLVRYAFVAVGCVLLLTPTLYPWYLVWIIPFLCVFPNRSWILFTALVFASYWVWVVFEETGEWRLPRVVYAIEYAPFLAALALGAWRARRRETSP